MDELTSICRLDCIRPFFSILGNYWSALRNGAFEQPSDELPCVDFGVLPRQYSSLGNTLRS
jgi:hypothetical protein